MDRKSIELIVNSISILNINDLADLNKIIRNKLLDIQGGSPDNLAGSREPRIPKDPILAGSMKKEIE